MTDSQPQTGDPQTQQQETVLGSALPEDKPEAKPADSAPSEIAYDIKAPKGVDDKDFAEVRAEVVAFAKTHKLSAEVAQAIADREAALGAKATEELNKGWEELTTKVWVSELRADKALGGDNFKASVSQANRAFQKLPEETRKLIVENRLSFNPTVFRIMHQFGGMLKEDSAVRGGEAQEPKKSMTLVDLFTKTR